MAKTPILNVWMELPEPQIAEILAKSGFTSVTVDTQHGLIDYAQALNCFRAIALHGARPFVRVPWNEPGIIMKMLDGGAEGIICPMISTPEEARAFVGACRYPFDGGYRSYGPARAAMMHDDYVANSAKIVTTFAMIETAEGYDNAAEIAATPGLDGFYIGPADLSLAFGMEPRQNRQEPEFLARLDHIRNAAHGAGKICGVHTSGADYASQMLERGFDMVTVTSDAGLLGQGAAAALDGVKKT